MGETNFLRFSLVHRKILLGDYYVNGYFRIEYNLTAVFDIIFSTTEFILKLLIVKAFIKNSYTFFQILIRTTIWTLLTLIINGIENRILSI